MVCCDETQTFEEAERHHWHSLEDEWDREKEKILNSLLGSSHELEVPAESKVGVVSGCRLYSGILASR